MNPLPKEVKLLDIEGNWQIVAQEFLPENSMIGLAFVKIDYKFLLGGVLRTPLGAYLLHSDNPNCLLQTNTEYWYLWAQKDIFIHHPLTINYNLYGL